MGLDEKIFQCLCVQNGNNIMLCSLAKILHSIAQCKIGDRNNMWEVGGKIMFQCFMNECKVFQEHASLARK